MSIPVGLAKLERAAQLLAEVRTIDDAKKVADIATAAEVYARRAKLGLESQNIAAEIRLGAERIAGEMLAKLQRGTGGRPKTGDSVSRVSHYAAALKKADVTAKEAQRYQQVAAVPKRELDGWVAGKKKAGEEISRGALLREVVREKRREERLEKIAEISGGNAPLESGRRFPLIYADPPWQYEAGTTDDSRVIENQYPTMTLEQICALPVRGLATPDALLFLWVPAPKLFEAKAVMDAWDFELRSGAVWDKEALGMGWFFRVQHEHLLVGERGSVPRPAPANRFRSIVSEKRGAHSAKPETFRAIIDRMYPSLPKLELFARGAVPEGWAAWGNQAEQRAPQNAAAVGKGA